MDEKKIKFTKKYNDTTNIAIQKILKESNTCLICKKTVSSFCHSHSIPISILNNMDLIDGKLIPFQAAAMKQRLTNIEKGKKNSSIFRNICRECDQNFFSKLDNMDIINDEWTEEILRLQAIRILLYKIFRTKEFAYSFYDFSKEGLSQSQINDGLKNDLEDINYYSSILEEALHDKEKTYKILFSKTLDYEINFACVNLMNIITNPFLDTIIVKGNKEKIEIETGEIDNKYSTIIKLDKYRNNKQFVYFIALPYEGKTKILLFSDIDSIAGTLLEVSFSEMNEKNILDYLSATLIISGNNIYGNEQFVENYGYVK